jgi:hypothetical protein
MSLRAPGNVAALVASSPRLQELMGKTGGHPLTSPSIEARDNAVELMTRERSMKFPSKLASLFTVSEFTEAEYRVAFTAFDDMFTDVDPGFPARHGDSSAADR